ncbi:ABC transporter ATP-binding protein [Microbacterium esteraromaticum]|uniref:ABC transporter ATP-binding protein n=1 Tax=Microbacterium esteraromaticum TaxID=57043 RepID=UPI0019D379F5|nr:ABC transporter ATP-binding protein [Microbacterium esteraromaticum]MBN7793632.1 ABC transporter ATP-binding protein [Microbacterium esteraromaticum]WDH79241.1 ABC transporter ATP-binding protein [Microbacterium esteraromaticum]
MTTLTISSLTKDFKSTQVLKGIDLAVESGEFISLLGPSGCGKTTLLRCIAGLESPTSGTIEIGGTDVTRLPPEKRHLGMMFQSYALFPHMTVVENVRFGLRMAGDKPKAEQRELSHRALERVQMGHLADRHPAQLSGGQQQRVALARAIAFEPRVLLLDEPLSNLDARLREDMQIELKELHRTLGLTTIFVTHDQEEAMSLSDRVVLMNGGVIEQEGAPTDLYGAPRSSFAADFIGSANLLPATRSGATAYLQGSDVAVTIGGAAPVATVDGEDGQVMLRQEDLHVRAAVDADAPVPVEIVTSVYRGADVVYVVELAGRRLRVVAPRHEVLLPAGPAGLGWREGAALWLAA